MTDIVWSPTEEYLERANVTRFMRAHGIETYDELVERSVEDVSWFWDAIVRDLDIEFLEPYTDVLDTSRGVEWATWFSGGRVNLAHPWTVGPSRRRTPPPSSGRARTARSSRGATGAPAAHRPARASARRLGIEAGRRGPDLLPMLPETVAALMACSKIGAIWVPIFSGFGTDAVAVRLEDANVKALLTADAFPRKGRPVGMVETARLARDRAEP